MRNRDGSAPLDAVMDYLLLAAVIAGVAIAFYAALRVYTRRQLRHRHNPPDKD